MSKWLEKLGLFRRDPIHPPWRAGQYVTYFLEREDGGWAAMALRALGQAEGGAWVLGGDFKTRMGECAVLFRSDPGAPAETPDLVPVQTKTVRRSPSVSDDRASLVEDPTMTVSLAMNLLMVRRLSPPVPPGPEITASSGTQGPRVQPR